MVINNTLLASTTLDDVYSVLTCVGVKLERTVKKAVFKYCHKQANEPCIQSPVCPKKKEKKKKKKLVLFMALYLFGMD